MRSVLNSLTLHKLSQKSWIEGNFRTIPGTVKQGPIRGLFILSLMFWLALGFSTAAYADKAPQFLIFDTEPAAVSVLSVYETTPDTQLSAVSTILKSSKAFFKGAAGFKGLSVLQSNDGSRVASLTQWADAASYEAFAAQPVEDYASKYQKDYQKEDKAGKPPETLTPQKIEVLELADMQIPGGMVPAIRSQGALVQLGEVSIGEAGDLSVLLAEVEAALPDVAKMYPAPRSVMLLKAVDDSEVVLMSYWGYAEEFEDLAQVPAVNVLSGVVDNAVDEAVEGEDREGREAIAPAAIPQVDQHLYRVVNVIVPKPPKQYGKSY